MVLLLKVSLVILYTDNSWDTNTQSMARHASNHSQSLPLLSASHPVKFCSFNGTSSTRLRKYLTTEEKFLCCTLRISKFLWTKRDVVFATATPFPEGARRQLRSPLLREVAESSLLGQKKSPRISWKWNGNTYEEKAQSLHWSSKKKDYSSFMLPSRQIITAPQRISHWRQTGNKLHVFGKPTLITKGATASSFKGFGWCCFEFHGESSRNQCNQWGSCLMFHCVTETGILGVLDHFPQHWFICWNRKEPGKEWFSAATRDHHLNQTPFLSVRQLIKITHRSADLS